MTDRPILFSAPMVRALLDGRKTQTRRILKPQPETFLLKDGESAPVTVMQLEGQRPRIAIGRVLTPQVVPYAVGDRLWVRETWCHTGTGVWTVADHWHARDGRYVYRATDEGAASGWFSSIHMPRRASRLTLIVTSVKIERLQDISEEDAEAEGVETDAWDMAPVARRYGASEGWFVGWPMGVSEPNVSVDAERVCRESFRSLWNSINGADAWDANPWVVALTFRVIKANIDAPEAAHD